MSDLGYQREVIDGALPIRNKSWKLNWTDSRSELFNRKNKTRCPLNESAALIWSLCDGEKTIGEIKDALKILYPDEVEKVLKDFQSVLEKLYDNHLIDGAIFGVGLGATPKGGKKKLSIGMATHDDYDGVYFTIQAIRMYHPEVTEDTEIIVIDNDPYGRCAQSLKHLEKSVTNFRYVPFDLKQSTSVRDIIFKEANSDYVLCIDCHVFIVPGAIRKLMNYFDSHADTRNLLQGPLLYDDLKSISTHMVPEWYEGLWGSWENDERGKCPENKPFEIPMQGAALFACRKDAWLGFNPRFTKFGGEEGYIHEKYRQAGFRTLCLPFLRWMHRFDHPAGTTYPMDWKSRIRNYRIGYKELGLDPKPIGEYYEKHIGKEETKEYMSAADQELSSPFYFFDGIYCINLDTESERWESMQKRFSELGILDRIVRFSAIPTPGNHHIGCALSHREVIHQASYLGLKNVLVFEDDGLILDNMLEHLTNSISEIPEQDWDLFYLGGCRNSDEDREIPGLNYLQSAHEVTTTVAIAYHHTIYDKILEDIPGDYIGAKKWIEHNIAIDQYLPDEVKKSFLCRPSLVTQAELIEFEDLQFGNFS